MRDFHGSLLSVCNSVSQQELVEKPFDVRL